MAGPYGAPDSRNYVGIGKQVSKGTGVAPTTFLGYVDGVELDHQQTINRLIEGGNYFNSFSEKVSHMPTGKGSILGRPKTVSQMFAYLMGVDTPGAPVSGVTPHVITDDYITDYLSIEQNLGNDATERFVDCVIGEISVTFDPQQRIMRATASWLGGSPAWQGSQTSTSYETDAPFGIWDGTYTVDGNARTNIRSFTIVTRFVFSTPVTTDVIPNAMQKLRLETELTLVQLMNAASDEYRLVQYGAVGNSAILKTATPGAFIADLAYGAAATARGAKFEIPNLSYDSASYSNLDPNGDVVEVTRHAMGVKTAGSPLFRFTGKTTDAAAYV